MNAKLLAALGLVGAGAITLLACNELVREPQRRRLTSGSRRYGDLPVIPLVTPEINSTSVEFVTTRLSASRGRPVALVIHTHGGFFQAVVQIARAVRRHGQVSVLVPFYALSGGTLVALAAESVHLWPHAALGPVDPQLGPFSAASLRAVIDAKPAEHVDDYTLALAHEAGKALEETTSLLRSLIGPNPEALRRLVAGVIPHSYPITVEEAAELGLPVSPVDPDDETIALVRSLIPGREVRTWPRVH